MNTTRTKAKLEDGHKGDEDDYTDADAEHETEDDEDES